MKILASEFLKSGKTLRELELQHGVYSHVTNGKLTITYDMLAADNSDPLSQQCRGLILDANTFEPVAVPFFRFFNYGQEGLVPADFDMSTATFYEKMDGTLLIVYYFNGKWMCGTRSRPEADGNIDGQGITFTQLADVAAHKMCGKNLHEMMVSLEEELGFLLKRLTFCFELTSPYNTIVVKYEEPWLTLLGVRDIDSLEEKDPRQFVSEKLKINTPKEHSFENISSMLEIVSSKNPTEHEGVVMCDSSFRRIKVKNAAYVAWNGLRDRLSSSWRGCLEIVLLGSADDAKTNLPKLLAERIIAVENALKTFLGQIDSDWERLRGIADAKEFALEAVKTQWSAPLFAMKRGKVASVVEFIGQSNKNGFSNGTLDLILGLLNKLDPTIGKI